MGLYDVGKLYGQFHCQSFSWFENIHARLVCADQLAEDQLSWASCLWVLPWLQRLVPLENRSALEEQGVDWNFLAAEIQSMPTLDALPHSGITAHTVFVHGDAHAGNIMWHQGQLRIIDFDMAAPGPA